MLHRFLNFFRPRALEADIREEIEFHRDRSKGSFGNAGLVADGMREASTIVWLETALRDIRYGVRQLLKSPVFLAVATLSLALGIGANTAIFTVMKAVILQPLPVHDPASLALFSDSVSEGVTSGDPIGDAVSWPFYRYLREHNNSFRSLCAFRQGEDDVTFRVAAGQDAGAEHASAHLVSGNYFDVLGVRAATGRLLRDADDTPASAPVSVMSYRLWQSRFHLDPTIAGKTVLFNGTAFTISGVAEASFFGERVRKSPDFWVPLSFQPQIMKQEPPMLNDLRRYWLNCMGRLRGSVSLKAAQTDVNARLHAFYLAQAGARPTAETSNKIQRVQIALKPGGGGISALRYRYSKPLRVLMAAVGLVLLIACANVATLLLARASARRQEFICRLALGASRGRVLRQALTESLLLAITGGVAGAFFAWGLVKALVAVLQFSPVVKVRPNPAIFGFTLGLSMVTGLAFGIVPGWRFSRLDPRPGNSAPVSRRTGRFGSMQALIAVQIALSVCLLTGAALLTHSLAALEEQDIGFTRTHILLIRTDADLAGYQPSGYLTLYRDVNDRLNQLPGVQSAAVTRFSPFSGYSSSGDFSIQGYYPPSGQEMLVWDLPVGPGLFETLGITLFAGRTIGTRDTAASEPVAVVNRMFVNKYLAGRNPIGRHMGHGAPFEAPGSEIVGVVNDSKYFDLREKPKPMVFYPMAQKPSHRFELVLRTAADPAGVAAEAREALKQINPRLPVLEEHTLNDQVENTLRPQKTITSLAAIFGLVALLLAAIGIYGTLAYSVAGRTAEIGVRMALGARRSHVLSLVLRDIGLVLLGGIAFGILFALVAARWIESFLFGVRPLDPLALGASILSIAGAALIAGYLPARRAAAIDPMRALRHE